MDQQSLGRKVIPLSVFILLGIAYSTFLYFQPMLTGRHPLDGIIGVVLGLYIGSHPAANLVEMLFNKRGTQYPFSSKRSVVPWLFLNVLVLLVGGIVIFVGTTRWMGRTELL